MVICKKCKKKIPFREAHSKYPYWFCENCFKDVKDNPKLLNKLQMDSGRNLELKNKTETIKQSKKITQVGKDNLVVKVKRERRSIIATIVLLLLGLSLIGIGVVVFIISIPLMLIIIGFFSGAGAMAIFGLGVYLMAISVYKSKEVSCPNCRAIKRVNVNIHSAFTCERCQKRVLIEHF